MTRRQPRNIIRHPAVTITELGGALITTTTNLVDPVEKTALHLGDFTALRKKKLLTNISAQADRVLVNTNRRVVSKMVLWRDTPTPHCVLN